WGARRSTLRAKLSSPSPSQQLGTTPSRRSTAVTICLIPAPHRWLKPSRSNEFGGDGRTKCLSIPMRQMRFVILVVGHRHLPLVYDELRKLATAKLSQEKPGQTLQATALVHEAYLRLVDAEKAQAWNSRGHFFAAAAAEAADSHRQGAQET